MSILKRLRPDGILDPKGKYLNPFNNQPYTKCYFNLSKKWSEYVTWTDHEKIFDMIDKNSVVLLIAATGAGKTVTIPKLLLHYFGYQQKIICTTPRQATTANAAEYAGICMDVPIFALDENCKQIVDPNITGKDKRIPTGNLYVGYTYSGVNFADRTTKLLFSTDGLIKQMILGDPDLTQYAGVIIDEAHERSVNIDVLMALILDVCKRRPEFKVIIMSATIDQSLFTDYFDRIGLKGKYTVYIPKNNNTQYAIDYRKEYRRIDRSKLVDIVYSKIESIILNQAYPVGDILAFVTSEAETVKVEKLIKRNIEKLPLNRRPYVIPFTATISQSNKDIATKKDSLKNIAPDPQFAPQGYAMKVIIATNVVESSVTFEDPLVYVVESGLAFEKKFDAANYCYETGKFYVSQASIKQRCGRTGRTNAGYCLQLYTDEQFTREFIEFTPPKIVLEDITKELLGLACLPMHGNVKQALDFIENKMIEPVRNYKDAIRVARENLVNMGFATESGDISPLGRVCNNFGMFDVKIAKMIIAGYYLGCMWYSIVLGALLHEVQSLDDLFYKPPGMEPSEVEEIVLRNIRNFKSETGDHITLLKIFDAWNRSQNRKQFCQQYGLNDYNLSKVQTTIGELHKRVKSNATQIRSLWLFGVPPEVLAVQDAVMYGGSSKTKTEQETDKELQIDRIESHIDKIFDNMANSSLPQILDSQFTTADLNMEEMVRGGGVLNHVLDDPKTQENSSTNYSNGGKRAKTRKNVQYGSGKKEEKEARKQEEANLMQKVKKWEKVMNIITLRDLKPKYINIPAEFGAKILGALYYGFSTNIAAYSGLGKKYTVKYSPLKGSIGKSILDIENITPPWVIYHEFVVSKEQNRETAKLSIVSGLDPRTMAIFLNLEEVKKKL